MRTPVRLNDGREMGYGLGWGLSRYRGRAVTHHAGGVPGYSSFVGRFLDDGMTIIVLSNIGLFDAGGLAKEIANALLNLPAPERVAVPVAASELDACAGVYDNFIGESLEVSRKGEALTVSGELTCDLISLGDATYASADDPDITVRFEQADERGYTRVMVVVPFYWYVVTRKRAVGNERTSGGAMSQMKSDESLAPLVFVHGSGDSAKSWALVIAALPDVPCVALDLPGHGALIEQPGPEAMSVADYAAFVRAEIERRGLSRRARRRAFAWRGHRASTRARRAGPRRRRRAGGDGRAAACPAGFAGRGADRSGDGAASTDRIWLRARTRGSPRTLSARDGAGRAGTLYRDLAACDTFDCRDQLERITCPALIVVGTEDRLTPPKYATYLYDHLSQATLVEIAGAGHYLPHEAPEELAAALRDWRAQTLN